MYVFMHFFLIFEKVALVRKIFKDLSAHSFSKGNTIDKATFLQYFPLPGMMGERLFAVFDRDGSGTIVLFIQVDILHCPMSIIF